MLRRFYDSQPLQLGDTVTLNATASGHISKVLRMHSGEPLIVFNGEGGEYHGRLITVDKKLVTVQLNHFNPEQRVPSSECHLGQVISRGDRMDYVIQKSTEMGVAQITPLFSERCEVKLKQDRLIKKQLHWQQIAISACEQCGLNRIPIIHVPIVLEHWLSQTQADIKLLLHTSNASPLADANFVSAALLIGPEGGFSDNEVALSEASGFKAWSLGSRVLRTETAPIAALALIENSQQ